MLSISYGIKKEFVKLRPNISWSFKNIGRLETNYLTHNYHRYPAKFIPNIVRRLVEDFTTTDNIICDPFGGCGTTLVEAKLLCRKSIGFDINPLSKLITQVKITPINPKRLGKAVQDFENKLKDIQNPPLEHNARIYYWFDEQTIQDLDRIYCTIKRVKNYKIKRFFLCAFSHILKNCSRWLMKSIKPTIHKDKKIPPPQKIFFQHLQSMVKRNEQFYNKLKESNCLDLPTKMRLCDSTKRLLLEDESVDLIITSPPYVTSYEYADLHQLSLLWFSDDLHNFKKWNRYTYDYNNFRTKFIGTRYKKERKGDYLSSIAQNIIDRLLKKDKRLAINVSNYFIDMRKSFEEMYRILKRNGKACIIIGNTSLRNTNITNAQVVSEQMQNIGFKKITYIKREMSSKMISSWRDIKDGRFTSLSNPNKRRIYKYEYIIIMEK